jgi:hypothetical protein
VKLPNGEFAIIDDEKILNYILDPFHREGATTQRFSNGF